MDGKETAYFVRRPRRLPDLMEPHPLEAQRRFEIVKTIQLRKIDWENFVTDMLADRQFIEDAAGFCEPGEIWKCLLVRRRGKEGGVLVMPEAERFVGWAACFGDCDG